MKTTKDISQAPDFYDHFSAEDLKLIKKTDPVQYKIIVQRLRLKLESKKNNLVESEKKKKITDFEDFL